MTHPDRPHLQDAEEQKHGAWPSPPHPPNSNLLFPTKFYQFPNKTVPESNCLAFPEL